MDLIDVIERRLLEELNPKVRIVLETGRYLLEGGGKRLRPLITVLTCGMCGGDPQKALPLGVGIEYIHTASLLHDDVVDGAQSRRGRKSANLIFGNGIAVLTGDYMYAKALQLFSTYGNMEMIRTVSEAVMEMAEAQILEITKAGEIISEEEYFRIIDGKTAVLFGACTAVGAMAAGHTDKEMFYTLGLHIGRAFQLVDDLLDYAGDSSKTGKPVGNDLREGKVTYPLLSVLDRINQDLVSRVIEDPNPDPSEVDMIRREVLRLGGGDRTRARAREEVRKAYDILKGIQDNPYKEDLIRILDFVVFREL